jgi:hypothetical protein
MLGRKVKSADTANAGSGEEAPTFAGQGRKEEQNSPLMAFSTFLPFV